MFQNNLLMGAASISAAGITVDESVRYNDGDSPRLYVTPSVAGNRRIGSISLWYKRSTLSTIMQLFNAGAGDDITFNASDQLTFIDSSGVSYITTQVFRDTTAWGHLLFAWDTTLAAAGDRLRIYHNGVEITAFATETDPDQNDEFEISNTVRQTVGANESDTEEFDGYLSQVYLVDGEQLTPTSFGEFNTNNVWRPIAYAGADGSDVTLALTDTSTDNAAATTYTFSGLTLGGTSSDYYIVGATGRQNTAGESDITSITVDGVAAVELVDSPGAVGSHHTGLWIAAATGNATGDIVVVFANGCDSAACAVWLGVNIGQTLFDSLAVVSAGGVDASGNISIPAGGGLICMADTDGATKSFTWTNATEVFDADAGDGDNWYSGTTDTFAAQTTDRTITVDQGSSTCRLVCASFGPSVAYGTNGFKFDFADSSDFGNDVSGNNNDYTSSGLAADQQVVDTPTNNFPTILRNTSIVTMSEGNLQVDSISSVTWHTVVCALRLPSTGKWCWEVERINNGVAMFGFIGDTNPLLDFWGATNSQSHISNNYQSYYMGYGESQQSVDGVVTSVASLVNVANGGLLQMILDQDAGTMAYYANGVLQKEWTGNNTMAYAYLQLFGDTWGVPHSRVDFGQDGFTRIDEDYNYICTANFPEPTILDGTKNFQTTLYTGDGSTRNIDQTGNSTFQPDFVWLKNRSQADNHMLIDAARGVTKQISSDDGATAEVTDADGLTSFDSDGFGLGTGAGGYNDDTESFVAWQWLAGGGAGSANAVGSITTTTTTVNTTAGISISTYTGNATGGATIGHGLGIVPQMILVKKLDTGNQWMVYHAANTTAPATEFLVLDKTDATVDLLTIWNDTVPTSTVFTLGSDATVNGTGGSYVAYVFANIEGFSHFGNYIGNGNVRGAPAIVGFKPAYVMIKKTTGTGGWVIYDSQRSPINEIDDQLFANTTAAETTGSEEIDFTALGFQIRTADSDVNTALASYVYAAFAEHPFGGGEDVTPATTF